MREGLIALADRGVVMTDLSSGLRESSNWRVAVPFDVKAALRHYAVN